MLMIRLARVGARKQPQYRIVVIEKDRIDYWRSKGAQFSETVGRLVAKQPATEAAPAA